jgi:hypothetical protein
MFIRFIAQKQLLADVTGQKTSLKAKRRGKGLFHQQFLPDRPVPTQATETSATLDANGESQHSGLPEETSSTLPWGDSQGPRSAANPQSQLGGRVDEALLEDIFRTAITPQNWPDLYQACDTPAAATELELKAAAEIVATYRRIQANQANPLVQTLNQLL